MSLAGLSLRDLEYLVAVAEMRHFGRAAARCAVSQPALSGQIRKLERFLGLTVFERTGRRVLLTHEGALLVERARAVIEAARQLLETAKGGGGAFAAPLRLGAIATLGPYVFPHVLRVVRRRLPGLDLLLSEGRTARLLDDLRRGELDAALLSLPPPETGFAARPLFFEPFVLVHPPGHRIARANPLTVERLEVGELVLLEDGHCLRDQAAAWCRTPPGVDPRRHAAGLETLRHMVAAGSGYSLMPALAVRDDGPDRLVAYTPFDDAAVGRTIGLVWRASDPRGESFARTAEALRAEPPAGVRPAAVQASTP